MTTSKQTTDYKIELINVPDARIDKVKTMMCQLDFDMMDYEKRGRLCFVSDSIKNRTYLRRYVNIAIDNHVDLLVFPELTIPERFVSDLVEVSKQFNMYIIGGTHYKKTVQGYINVCPIVTPFGLFETEKISPSPFEISSFKNNNEGVINGKSIKVFRGTKIGDFAVTICLDYTNDELRNAIGKDKLDFLIVCAFNNRSKDFYYSMQTDVQRSSDGLYLLYSNVKSDKFKGDGKSAVFAFMDQCFKEEFKDKKCTDLEPPNKIYEFAPNRSYCIFELDLEHKKPFISKNGYTDSNVKILEEDSNEMDKRYTFANIIGATDDIYLNIDKYYVKPKEYDDMLNLLERNNVLVITGDPGIGKTYTAIHFLKEYYSKGYRPTWFYGLAKEDRDKQQSILMNFEPQEHDVVYIEDPFGRTVFENREELKTLFAKMIQRFRVCKAKLIITSRSEVFKQFKSEILYGDRLEDYKKELNVWNPSYEKNDLKHIAELYLKEYTTWSNNKDLVAIVMDGIEKNRLISPLMIYNMIRNNSTVTDIKVLKEQINSEQKLDLISQFADEIKILSFPAKILLYLVLLYGRKNISLHRGMFGKVQSALYSLNPFEGSSFEFEIRKQEGHRIQRIGANIPVYRFSHPTYEEALIELSKNDTNCHLIAVTILHTIVKEDSEATVAIIKRFIIRYPEFLKRLIQEVDIQEFNHFDEIDKLDLIRKMSSSNIEEFVKIAKKIYPINKLIDNLYSKDTNNLFVLRLKALNKRKNEIGKTIIDWQRIFNIKRISQLAPKQFLLCYKLASAIEDNLIVKIEGNLQKTDIIKKFILLPSNDLRDELNNILSKTSFRDLYQNLKDKIPEEIMKAKNHKRRYIKILRKYVLKSEAPKGIVILDKGAFEAVRRGANIYPIGVTNMTGKFEKGDIVYLMNKEKYLKVLTIVELSSTTILEYMGLHSSEIYNMVGEPVNTVVSKGNYRDWIPNWKVNKHNTSYYHRNK